MALAKRDEGSKVSSEINVTPMVDVMLVLLIIFMVVTPMLQKGISVDMAKVNNPEPMQDADKEDALLVSITRDAPAYLFSVNAPSSARADAAAASAGHDTLVALYPKWKAALDQQLASKLATIPDGPGKQQGIQVGRAVAARLIAIRANDGSAATPQPFVPGNQPGNYRPTPPKFPAPVFTNWGNVTPFVLNNAAQFRPGPPPSLTSQAYAQALNEVKSLGQNTSTTRTPEQTVIAKFWAGPIWNTWNEIAENAALNAIVCHDGLLNRIFTSWVPPGARLKRSATGHRLETRRRVFRRSVIQLPPQRLQSRATTRPAARPSPTPAGTRQRSTPARCTRAT